MGVITLIANALGAVKEFFGFQNKKLELNNSKEMKDAKVAQTDQDQKDKINKAISEKNEDEIRKLLS